MHLGDFDTSAVIYGKFTTYRPSTGATFTLGGTPALSVYKDNSTTQSTTGVTLTADFDAVTGLNHFAIDTSADGTFYSAGSFFDIVITTGTVDSVSVTGSVVGRFTLRKNSALKPTTAGRALDVSAGGEAGVDWANVGSPTTSVGLTGTTISTTQQVASVSGAVGSVTGNVGGNVTGSIGSLAAQAKADVNAEVDSALDTAIPAVPTANSVNERIQTMDNAYTAARAGNLDNLDVAVSTRLATAGYTAPLDAAGTRGAVGLASANLDTQIGTLATAAVANAIKAKTDSLTFTVAGQVDANVQAINDVTITGNGQVGTEFGV